MRVTTNCILKKGVPPTFNCVIKPLEERGGGTLSNSEKNFDKKVGGDYLAGRAITKETIKKNTIQNMKKLNVYKAEYDAVIDTYSELREQYELYTKELKNKGYKYSEYTFSGGEKKSPLIAVLETLRKDILQYSIQLGLTPAGLKKINEKNEDESKKNLLAEALSKIEKI